MIVVHVRCRVSLGDVEAFTAATLANARASVREAGVLRFDVLQEAEEPDRFVLVEVYRTEQDPARHKETAHYLAWHDAVAGMMVERRQSTSFSSIFPDDPSGWVYRPAATGP